MRNLNVRFLLTNLCCFGGRYSCLNSCMSITVPKNDVNVGDPVEVLPTQGFDAVCEQFGCATRDQYEQVRSYLWDHGQLVLSPVSADVVFSSC